MVMSCPNCDGDYTHQGKVIVYSRDEDDKRTVVTTVDEMGVASHAIMPSNICRNPSARRQGLAIQFECETCGVDFELTIAQHKGNTIVETRRVKAASKANRK